jgi:hypothetical protein
VIADRLKASRTRTALFAAFDLLLQVAIARGRPFLCHPADDGYERHAGPVPFEVEFERHTRRVLALRGSMVILAFGLIGPATP